MGDTYTIQICSSLVNKLARDEEGRKKKAKKSKPKVPEVAHKHQNEPNSVPAAPKSCSGGAWPVQPPMFLPCASFPSPSPQSTCRARSHLSWVMKKLEQREANMPPELTQRAKELRDKEFKLPYQKSMPSEAEREACRQCYQEHSKQPLKRAQVVRSVDDCTRRARRQQEVNSKV